MPRGPGRSVGRAVAPAGLGPVVTVVRGAVIAVVLGAVVAAASVLFAPSAQADVSLRLSPDHGTARTVVQVEGTGFQECLPETTTVVLLWDSTELGRPPIEADGRFHASFKVPENARPAAHQVKANCRVIPLPTLKESDAPSPGAPNLRAPFDLTAAATFTVDPEAPETLALDPASGPAGREFTAHGTGFFCPADEPVVLSWDERELGRVRPADGAFDQQVTAPPDAPPGAHPVEAYCGPATEYDATATFTVLTPGGSSPSGGVTPGAGPVLRVDPGTGRPGQQVVLTGSGFACRGADAELTWNDVAWEHVTTEGGGFVVTIRVADDARPGHYRLRAVCSTLPGTAATTEFEVLSAGSGPGPDTGGGGGGGGSGGGGGGGGNGNGGDGGDATPTALVVGSTAGGAVVLAALAGTYLLGRRRGPRWASGHVIVAPTAGAPTLPQVGETADPAGPGRTVRLESRSEPGTHRIEEVGGGPSGEGAPDGGTPVEETEEEGP